MESGLRLPTRTPSTTTRPCSRPRASRRRRPRGRSCWRTRATIANGGTYAPVSLCTDIGWPVADLFQNLFLKLNGAVAYNQLAAHAMKWSSPDVTKTFAELAQLTVGSGGSNLLGGMKGALADGAYPNCVASVFPAKGSPTAAMVFEADFVTSSVPSNYSPSNGKFVHAEARRPHRATTRSTSRLRAEVPTRTTSRDRATWRCC
jgi:hypothetical protein